MPVLQALGLHVSPVPTVLLGNTPHCPTMHGGPLPQDWFEGLLDDLEAREVATRARCVLVGYLGTPQQGLALSRWLRRMRQANPALVVQIDPVISDHDTGPYTDPALLPVRREHLLPCADSLTPNHFELEQLCGRRLDTLADCSRAATGLLGGQTRWIAVTSAAPRSCPPGRMQVAVVTRNGCEYIEHAQVPHAVKGGGDLFAALLAGRLLAELALDNAVRRSCDDVVAILRHVQAQGWQELALPRHIAHRLV